jgi:hypothetical protein
MLSEGNAPKNCEPTVGFTFTTMLQHPVSFGQAFLSKQQCDNTGASPTLSLPDYGWFHLFPQLKSTLKGRRSYDTTDVTKIATEELKKAFTKWLPEMFPTPLQSLAEVHSCTRGLFWRNCSFKDCIVLYIWEMKLILGTVSSYFVERPLRQYKCHFSCSFSVLQLVYKKQKYSYLVWCNSSLSNNWTKLSGPHFKFIQHETSAFLTMLQ